MRLVLLDNYFQVSFQGNGLELGVTLLQEEFYSIPYFHLNHVFCFKKSLLHIQMTSFQCSASWLTSTPGGEHYYLYFMVRKMRLSETTQFAQVK